VFGVLAVQRWNDRTWRWLWYTFLANTAGAIFDLTANHLPTWVSHGINVEMIPLSYALLNVVLIYFNRLGRWAAWVSGLILLGGLPFLMAWRNMPVQVKSNALGDLLIGLECVVTVVLLVDSREKPTRAPRLLMGGFLAFFVVVELARGWVALAMNGNPDVTTPRLGITSVVMYIVNTSLLPLAFLWMMHARLEWDLLQQSIVDPLTAVLNRRGLQQALERELARCRRYGEELTLAMVDLDHFKRFNDKYGHAAGDTVLKRVAQLLGARLRETDVVARLGGEEFVLLLPHTDLDQSGPILEHLRQALRGNAELLPSADIRATASFGATSTDGRNDVGAEDLLSEADKAMYAAKAGGRDRVCFFEGAVSNVAERERWSGMQEAGEPDEL
jgi:diguanylate cyclase (GGDEF)-like protein